LPVEDSEIAALQLVVSSGVKADPCPYLEVGQRIKIDHGALSGLQGILTSFRGSERIVVSVSLLCRSVSLEIQRSDVSPILTRGALGKKSLAVGRVLEPVVA
jgi:transcription antitermination factor NusG